MNSILSFVLIACASCCVLPHSKHDHEWSSFKTKHDHEWNSFKTKHRKNYRSNKTEESIRYGVSIGRSFYKELSPIVYLIM